MELRAKDPAAAKRYRLLSRHFEACLDLSGPEREHYFTSMATPDAEFLMDLQVLLKIHDTNAGSR